MDILYLHGLASSPRGRKLTLLRELLEPEGIRIVAPDLNVPSFAYLDFEAMVNVALDEARVAPPSVVVGSSLGAMVALEVARRGLGAPLVLVSPALAMGERWARRLPPGDPVPLYHHGELRVLPIHRAFFEAMWDVTADHDPPPVAVSILMGRLDESVPYEVVEETWRRWRATGRLADGSEFVSIEDGDHGLVEFVPWIAAAVRRRAGTP